MWKLESICGENTQEAHTGLGGQLGVTDEGEEGATVSTCSTKDNNGATSDLGTRRRWP